jgi:hypothetical protein
MGLIFPDLYRLTEVGPQSRSYSYLVVRKRTICSCQATSPRRRSGTRFLFTGHVMIFDGGRWKLNYNPTKAPKGTQFDHVAEAEHFLPTHAYGTEEFHTLNKRTRALFLEAVKQAWDAPKPSDRDVF